MLLLRFKLPVLFFLASFVIINQHKLLVTLHKISFACPETTDCLIIYLNLITYPKHYSLELPVLPCEVGENDNCYLIGTFS